MTPFVRNDEKLGFASDAECKGKKSKENEGFERHLNTYWGLGLRITGSATDGLNNGLEQRSLSRRSSVASTCTLWPGRRPNSSEEGISSPPPPSNSTDTDTDTIFSALGTEEADIGARRLGSLGLCVVELELDEYGHEIEAPLPAPLIPTRDPLARDGLIKPDAFGLKNLEEALPGPMHAGGLERQKATKPVQPFPKEEPQRKGEGGKRC